MTGVRGKQSEKSNVKRETKAVAYFTFHILLFTLLALQPYKHRALRAPMPTIFSKIINREIPAQIVYEDEHLLAFKDVHPQAPVHVLFIPKEPIASADALEDRHAELVGRLVLAARRYAQEIGIAESGYRLVMNTNADGGQTVFHLHLHLLGGRPMHWPPG